MKRTVIKINEELCIGCGACVNGCHAGVLQVINGKARVFNEMLCDGLGACIGECPVDAITLEEREFEPCQDKSCCNSFTRSRQFPIQLRLVSPNAPYLKNRDLVLAADCTAFVCNDFHDRFTKNSSLIIACPKLDDAKDFYVAKLTAMIEHSEINSLTVIMMEVPCCGGLWRIAQEAQANAKRKIPITKVVIEIK